MRAARPRALAAVHRRTADLDAAEDAVQEALAAATVQWPREGVPDDPAAWLVRVAARRLVDAHRSTVSRRDRERRDLVRTPDHALSVPAAEESVLDAPPSADDTLRLLVMCAHPALPPASQVALTLRTVTGLTTAEVARALLVPEPTVAQRISRAKRTLREDDRPFSTLRGAEPAEVAARLAAVLHVLYLVFTEGHTATTGPALHRPDLTARAIGLTREVHEARPEDPAVTGLLALMLLTEARAPARTGADGAPVPLAAQDRTLWDRAMLEEGLGLTARALRGRPVGSYALQAAVAAVHAEAVTADATDWPQIVALYDLLAQVDRSPLVLLSRAVAVAEADGPSAGLDALAGLDEALGDHHRLLSVRGQLRARAGDVEGSHADLAAAAAATPSEVERRYLDGLLDGSVDGSLTEPGRRPPGA